jgi:large subunit ribosomal protein L25
MEKLKLTAQPRSVLGKKVKALRKQGLIPANIFGKDLKSKNIQVDAKELNKVFRQAGETGLLELKVKEEIYPTLISNAQRDPLLGSIIHVDFHKVNLKEKISARVPLKLVGESPAEKSGTGLVLQTLNELEVEALPTDLPHELEVAVDKLTEVGQAILVKEIKVDQAKVEVKNDPEEVVVTVQTAEMKEEEPESQVAPEEVEATQEKGEEPAPEEGEPGDEKEAPSNEEEKPAEG